MFCRNNLANQYIVGQYLLGLNKGKHLDYEIHPRSKLIQPTVRQLKVKLDIIREHPLASSPLFSLTTVMFTHISPSLVSPGLHNFAT